MNRKTICITGAASGIGRAVALLFAQRNWFVGLYDIAAQPLAELHALIGAEKSCYAQLDVTDPQSISVAFEQFSQATDGRMDVLFNSAGVLEIGHFEEIRTQRHQQIIAVNVLGVIQCTHAAFPLLKQTPNARVINMSSASAAYGTPDFASYSASKFAIRGLTEALNLEWARHDIAVCDIMPAFVDTPMLREARHSRSIDVLGVRLTAEQVAAVVWQAAHGRRVHWPVSRQFRLLHRLSSFLPSGINRRVIKRISGY